MVKPPDHVELIGKTAQDRDCGIQIIPLLLFMHGFIWLKLSVLHSNILKRISSGNKNFMKYSSLCNQSKQ